MTIKYSISSGVLPVGVTLNEDDGRLIGEPSFSNLDLGPTWNTGTPAAKASLGSFDEGAVLNFTAIKASARGTAQSVVSYSIKNEGDGLPWGILLHPTTGNLTGTFGLVKSEQAAALDNKNENPPSWTTPFGNMADIGEVTAFSKNLTATAKTGKTLKSYNLQSGELPRGIALNPITGVLSGTTAEFINEEPAVLVLPINPPSWNTPAGTLVTGREGDAFSITLKATGALTKTIRSYEMVDGAMAFGIALNPITGVLSGNFAEIIAIEPTDIIAATDPVINNRVKVGSNFIDTIDGVIGNFATGANVTITFTSTITTGRTQVSVILLDEYSVLPKGLVLNPVTGVISGTISTQAEKKTYNLVFRVVDSARVGTNKTFTLTVQ